MTVISAHYLKRNVDFYNTISISDINENPVAIDDNGCPTDLIGTSNHFCGSPKSRRIEIAWCPMDEVGERNKSTETEC